eukprot:Lankesteria_metandrocarpae@DN964_c0_g1_i1.p1
MYRSTAMHVTDSGGDTGYGQDLVASQQITHHPAQRNPQAHHSQQYSHNGHFHGQSHSRANRDGSISAADPSRQQQYANSENTQTNDSRRTTQLVQQTRNKGAAPTGLRGSDAGEQDSGVGGLQVDSTSAALASLISPCRNDGVDDEPLQKTRQQRYSDTALLQSMLPVAAAADDDLEHTAFGVALMTTQPSNGFSISPRWGLTAAVLGKQIFVFGGYLWVNQLDGFFNDLHVIDLDTNFIRRLPSTSTQPEARFGQSLVADTCRNRIILFGGRNSVDVLADVWTFSASTSKWLCNTKHDTMDVPVSEKSPLNAAPTSAARGYRSISTATTSINTAQSPDEYSPDPLPYNYSVDSALNVPAVSGVQLAFRENTGCPPRCWHSAVLNDGSMFVYGGWDIVNKPLSDVWQLDTKTLLWKCVWPVPYTISSIKSPIHDQSFAVDPISEEGAVGRSCHCAAVHNNEMFVFGGIGANDKLLGDMKAFSFDSFTWREVKFTGTAPVCLVSAASVVMSDFWIIHGGLTDFPAVGAVASSAVYSFHFPTLIWRIVQVALPDGGQLAVGACRYGHTAVALAPLHGVEVTDSSSSNKWSTSTTGALRAGKDSVVISNGNVAKRVDEVTNSTSFDISAPVAHNDNSSVNVQQQQLQSAVSANVGDRITANDEISEGCGGSSTAMVYPPVRNMAASILLIGGAQEYAMASTAPMSRLDFLSSTASSLALLGGIREIRNTFKRFKETVDTMEKSQLVRWEDCKSSVRCAAHRATFLADQQEAMQGQFSELHSVAQTMERRMASLEERVVNVEHYLDVVQNLGASLATASGAVARGPPAAFRLK